MSTLRATVPLDASAPAVSTPLLRLDPPTFRTLFDLFGPSLGLWRAAEIAALREQTFEPPVLDLGCGDGLVTSLIPLSIDVGLDRDATSLARARQTGAYKRLVRQTAERMDLPPNSVATVVSNSVLEHVAQIDSLLAAVARVLKPGGRLIFTAPTEAFSNSLLVPSADYSRWRNRRLEHRNLWSVGHWSAHLVRFGFDVVLVRPYLRPGLVRLWDALELLQLLWLGRRRLFSMVWRRMPRRAFDGLAHRAAGLDLSAPEPGGGRLIVARKR